MKAYTKITLWYLGFGVLWIFFSDRILKQIVETTELMTAIQTMKGWLFVILSGALIYYISKRSFASLLRKEDEKRSIFQRTLGGAHHILLNYLNQMQLIVMEAQRSKDFDQRILEVSQSVTKDAKEALLKLDNIEQITEKQIDSAVYGKLNPASGRRS